MWQWRTTDSAAYPVSNDVLPRAKVQLLNADMWPAFMPRGSEGKDYVRLVVVRFYGEIQ
jgi:hypothetical protein